LAKKKSSSLRNELSFEERAQKEKEVPWIEVLFLPFSVRKRGFSAN